MKKKQQSNYFLPGKTIKKYLQNYAEKLYTLLDQIPSSDLERVVDQLHRCRAQKSHVYVAGNGGSSAIAAHLCCDWMKGSRHPGKSTLKVHSLTENSALMTALSNDLGYENSLAEQIKYLGESGDLLVLISSSGNSPNILRAAEVARTKKMKIISFTGFLGGDLIPLSDLNLHIPFENYGIVEDCHQLLMHVVSQFVYLQLSDIKKTVRRISPLTKPDVGEPLPT